MSNERFFSSFHYGIGYTIFDNKKEKHIKRLLTSRNSWGSKPRIDYTDQLEEAEVFPDINEAFWVRYCNIYYKDYE